MLEIIEQIQVFAASLLQGDKQAIVLVMCIYLLLIGGYSSVFQWRVCRWPSVIGSLDIIGQTRFSHANNISDRQYRAQALYHYEINGKNYSGRRISTWTVVASHNARGLLNYIMSKVELIGDNQVRVYYDPSKPSKSFLLQPGLIGRLVTLALAILPTGLYIYHY